MPAYCSAVRPRLIEPSTDQMLRYCAAEPIERVFLEDVARRAQGRFAALADAGGELTALCHLGGNLVPSGVGCQAFADLAAKSGARMLIGESGAVSDLWDAARRKLPRARIPALLTSRSISGCRRTPSATGASGRACFTGTRRSGWQRSSSDSSSLWCRCLW